MKQEPSFTHTPNAKWICTTPSLSSKSTLKIFSVSTLFCVLFLSENTIHRQTRSRLDSCLRCIRWLSRFRARASLRIPSQRFLTGRNDPGRMVLEIFLTLSSDDGEKHIIQLSDKEVDEPHDIADFFRTKASNLYSQGFATIPCMGLRISCPTVRWLDHDVLKSFEDVLLSVDSWSPRGSLRRMRPRSIYQNS
ncbi:hypothetical protein EDB89DRAFT_642660 [Lactarius sanguifluus]|nr:hypothetical protein EDB89DRAFT_642660 [Lactarius sanguifluus]